MKFYLVELTHKETGKVFQKFGITNSRDILDRFDYSKYPERIGYKDFHIRPLFSIFVNENKAKMLEKHYLSLYGGFNVNKYLNKSLNEGYNTNNLTGITEMVYLGWDRNKVLKELFDLKKS